MGSTVRIEERTFREPDDKHRSVAAPSPCSAARPLADSGAGALSVRAVQVSGAELLFWTFAVAGAALVLTQSSITRPLRDALTRAADYTSNVRWSWQEDRRRRRAEPHLEPLPKLRRRLPLIPLSYPLTFVAKLAGCPMCSGFWIGMLWAHVLGVCWPWAVAFGCAGAGVAAIFVAAWLLAGEAHAAIGTWRFIHTPPPGMHAERCQLAERLNHEAHSIRCPRYRCGAVAGEECRP
jgi:hypothetical protein